LTIHGFLRFALGGASASDARQHAGQHFAGAGRMLSGPLEKIGRSPHATQRNDAIGHFRATAPAAHLDVANAVMLAKERAP
jgi:hypothetical protein